MSTTKQQERDAFIGVLSEAMKEYTTAGQGNIFEVADQFMKLARTLERINVRECNGYVETATCQRCGGNGEEPGAVEFEDAYCCSVCGGSGEVFPQQTKDKRAGVRTEARLKDLCRHYGFELNLGGDPRGYAVKLILPTGRYNTFGGKGEGYGVPT